MAITVNVKFTFLVSTHIFVRLMFVWLCSKRARKARDFAAWKGSLTTAYWRGLITLLRKGYAANAKEMVDAHEA